MLLPYVSNIKKWVDANMFKIKLVITFLVIILGLIAVAYLWQLFGIDTLREKIIFVGVITLVVTHFISYRYGFKKSSEEIKRFKKAVSNQENLASQVVKLQEQVEVFKKEIDRKKEAYGHLKHEIRKIKSQEDREVLEQRWDEIKDQYGMTIEKIQETAAPFAEIATERVKGLVKGTQGLLEKGMTQTRKGIFRVFKKEKKNEGGKAD